MTNAYHTTFQVSSDSWELTGADGSNVTIDLDGGRYIATYWAPEAELQGEQVGTFESLEAARAAARQYEPGAGKDYFGGMADLGERAARG